MGYLISPTDLDCPKCGRKLRLKQASQGVDDVFCGADPCVRGDNREGCGYLSDVRIDERTGKITKLKTYKNDELLNPEEWNE